MEIAKVFSDLIVVTVATVIVLAPRALDAYLAIRQQQGAESNEE